MKRRLSLWGLTLLVVACGGGGSPRDPDAAWLAGEGRPVNLALTLEAEHGQAALFTPRGGTFSVYGADGTEYELEVPEGALLSNEEISLIPVARVKNLPLKGGSIAAVQLEPEGLQLLKPATLRIRTRTDVPVAEQVGFAYFADGQDAHLYPLSRDPTQIELPIFHFSGYGFGRAAPNDPGRIALQQAADKEARLAARLAEALSRERGKPEGEQSDAIQLMVAHFIQYYQEVVRPLMQIAESDERMAECALQNALGWEHQMAILGITQDDDPVHPNSGWPELEPLRAEATVSGQRIIENYKRKFGMHFVKQCREEHDVFAASNYVIEAMGLVRMAAITGSETDEFVPYVTEDPVFQEILKCLSFELEFRSVFETKTAEGDVSQHYHVHARVPIEQMLITHEGFGVPYAGVPARAPLKYVAFSSLSRSANGKITTSGVGTRESELTVFGLNFVKTKAPGKKDQTSCAGQDEGEGFVTDTVRVRLSPGEPVELVRVSGPGFNEVSEGNGWLHLWNVFRQSEKANYDASAFSDAEGSDAYVLALRQERPGTWRVDYESTKRDQGYELEDSYVVLTHTPK